MQKHKNSCSPFVLTGIADSLRIQYKRSPLKIIVLLASYRIKSCLKCVFLVFQVLKMYAFSKLIQIFKPKYVCQ